jgi:curved DNA-binding protein
LHYLILVADPYRTLGVSRTASADEIKRAFRKLARTHHPDVTGNDPEATKRFQQMVAAYEILSDDQRRRSYDIFGGNDGVGPAYPKLDFEAVLDQLWPNRKKKPRPEVGTDDERSLSITMAESLTGVDKTVGTLTVKVPAGIASGARLRLKQQGKAGIDGGPAGDLFVRIDVLPDPRLWRDGNDLHVIHTQPLRVFVLGAQVAVPLPHGTLRLQVPAGTQGGHAFRIKGRGFVARTMTGDVVVELQVQIPVLDSSQHEAAAALLTQLERLAQTR